MAVDDALNHSSTPRKKSLVADPPLRHRQVQQCGTVDNLFFAILFCRRKLAGWTYYKKNHQEPSRLKSQPGSRRSFILPRRVCTSQAD